MPHTHTYIPKSHFLSLSVPLSLTFIIIKIFELFGVVLVLTSVFYRGKLEPLLSLLQPHDWKCFKDKTALMKSFLFPAPSSKLLKMYSNANVFFFFMSNHCLRPSNRLKKFMTRVSFHFKEFLLFALYWES